MDLAVDLRETVWQHIPVSRATRGTGLPYGEDSLTNAVGFYLANAFGPGMLMSDDRKRVVPPTTSHLYRNEHGDFSVILEYFLTPDHLADESTVTRSQEAILWAGKSFDRAFDELLEIGYSQRSQLSPFGHTIEVMAYDRALDPHDSRIAEEGVRREVVDFHLRKYGGLVADYENIEDMAWILIPPVEYPTDAVSRGSVIIPGATGGGFSIDTYGLNPYTTDLFSGLASRLIGTDRSVMVVSRKTIATLYFTLSREYSGVSRGIRLEIIGLAGAILRYLMLQPLSDAEFRRRAESGR